MLRETAHQEYPRQAPPRLWRNRSVKITTTAESGDIKSQSTHGPEHLTSERLPGNAATIADICAAITKLVEAVSETGGERDPQTGLPRVSAEDTDTLWRSVCEFAASIVARAIIIV